MDRAKFFDALRASSLYNAIPQTAVRTLDCILDATDSQGVPVEYAAYMMATGYHEVGATLLPVRESLYYSSASRICAVWPSRFPTTASAQPYVKQPQKLANKVYGNRLGNVGPNDGWLYRGGGLPQTTGKANYAKVGKLVDVDLVNYPERIIEPRIAVAALVKCMQLGTYTGKKLSDYKLPLQYYEARAIINADKDRFENGKRIGERIAGYAREFEKALRVAGYSPGNGKPAQGTSPPSVSVPPIDHVPVTPSQPAVNFWQRLAEFFSKWLGGRK